MSRGVPELVRFMTVYPETITLTRVQHVKDGHDDCRACSGQLHSIEWPCVQLLSALEAQELLAVRHGGRSPGLVVHMPPGVL